MSIVSARVIAETVKNADLLQLQVLHAKSAVMTLALALREQPRVPLVVSVVMILAPALREQPRVLPAVSAVIILAHAHPEQPQVLLAMSAVITLAPVLPEIFVYDAIEKGATDGEMSTTMAELTL